MGVIGEGGDGGGRQRPSAVLKSSTQTSKAPSEAHLGIAQLWGLKEAGLGWSESGVGQGLGQLHSAVKGEGSRHGLAGGRGDLFEVGEAV